MDQKGFSFIEMLMVLIIISVLAIIAIPNLRDVQIRANETWATTYMRSWSGAQELYHSKFKTYASSDDDLLAQGYISGVTGSGSDPKFNGYSFEIRGGAEVGSNKWWEGFADPVMPGVTGNSHYYITSRDNYVIHVNNHGRAGAGDPAL